VRTSLVEILQSTPIFLRTGVRSRDNEDRRPRHVRVGDPGDCIRHARTRRDECDAKFSRQFGMGMRHMNGRPFIPHVDDAYAEPIEAHPDRHDVATAECEHTGDAARREDARDQIGDSI
jgi:hypothetical protein